VLAKLGPRGTFVLAQGAPENSAAGVVTVMEIR